MRLVIDPLAIGIWMFDYEAELHSLAGLFGQFGVIGKEVEVVGPNGSGYELGKIQVSQFCASGHSLQQGLVPFTLPTKSIIL